MPCQACAEKRRKLAEALKAKQFNEAAKEASEGLKMMLGKAPKPPKKESVLAGSFNEMRDSHGANPQSAQQSTNE